jgi:predicted metal-dependent hydrolase
MDIWNTTTGSLFLRRLAMMLVLPTYMWYVGKNTIIFLYTDKQLWKWRTLMDMCSFLFNSEYGVVRKSFVPWLDFMEREFHPNQHDHSELIKCKELRPL